MNKVEILTQKIKQVISGEIQIPYNRGEYNSVNDYWYPHPPALFPLFLGSGAFYYGIINHFFINRQKTFVEYSLETGYISERYRNSDQFLTKLLLEMIMLKEEITDEIVDFAEKIDYKNVSDIYAFAEKYGDNPEEFKHLIFFESDLPLFYAKSLEEYKGDYPSSSKILNVKQIHNSCSFEIADPSHLKEIQNLPKWLIGENPQKELFDELLKQNDIKGAWLTLNSKGWQLEDVAIALAKLKFKTNDKLFHLVADNWIDGWANSNFKEDSY
ncbi:hypothetical protein [Pedobacter psychrotolerans]|uniref:hypothetical protein n=1 Tax=Pedobacter psychrotolerans TaxID=1843235 RepID=UPI001049B6ED|nr:hypothetical protein [Pedobacter psychrotolerans]